MVKLRYFSAYLTKKRKEAIPMGSVSTTAKKLAAKAAKAVVKKNANETCFFFAHQPKLPKDARKLRKF